MTLGNPTPSSSRLWEVFVEVEFMQHTSWKAVGIAASKHTADLIAAAWIRRGIPTMIMDFEVGGTDAAHPK